MPGTNINLKLEVKYSQQFLNALERLGLAGQVSCAQLIYITSELNKLRLAANELEMRQEYMELLGRSTYPGLTLKEWRRRQELGRQIFETRKLKD